MQVMINFNAAILESSHSPLVVDEISFRGPLAAGQVLLRIFYSGVCGAQINEIDAVKGPDRFLPHLLGHEGIGEVIEVGPSVSTVAQGDMVVMHWMVGDGLQSDPPKFEWRGREVNAGWITTFSEYTVASENRVTRVSTDMLHKYLPLFGCAALTAWGSLVNDGHMRLGDSVVVLGAGGVGLLTVEAARAGGAHPIVVVDRFSDRAEAAQRFGAESVFVSDRPDLEDGIRQVLGSRGCDLVIETTGAKSMIELAYRMAAHGGRAVLVGVPQRDNPASLNTLDLHFGMTLTGSKGGSVNPSIDIPRLVDLAERDIYRVTSIPVSEFCLGDINEGIDGIRNGQTGRIVINMMDS